MGTFSRIPIDNNRKLVSNPLGWDGDIFRIAIDILYAMVSNPLGWDGDAPVAPLRQSGSDGF